MQNGSIMRSERRRGPDVWEYRWREPGPDGRRKHRRMVVGSVILVLTPKSATALSNRYLMEWPWRGGPTNGISVTSSWLF